MGFRGPGVQGSIGFREQGIGYFGMFRCHANPAISRQIGRVGAEVCKKREKNKTKETLAKRRSLEG